jgi:hypothetical protein
MTQEYVGSTVYYYESFGGFTMKNLSRDELVNIAMQNTKFAPTQAKLAILELERRSYAEGWDDRKNCHKKKAVEELNGLGNSLRECELSKPMTFTHENKEHPEIPGLKWAAAKAENWPASGLATVFYKRIVELYTLQNQEDK